jgi:hypothetical protein
MHGDRANTIKLNGIFPALETSSASEGFGMKRATPTIDPDRIRQRATTARADRWRHWLYGRLAGSTEPTPYPGASNTPWWKQQIKATSQQTGY